MFVRRAAFDDVGPFDDRYFLFSEEVDAGCAGRPIAAGLSSSRPRRAASTSAAPRTASACSGRTSAGNLRYLSLHGRPGEAERARRMLRAALAVRGRLYRGERGRLYRDAAAWLGSGDVESLLTG